MVDSFVTLNTKKKAFASIASKFITDFLVTSPPISPSMRHMVFALYEMVHSVINLKGPA